MWQTDGRTAPLVPRSHSSIAECDKNVSNRFYSIHCSKKNYFLRSVARKWKATHASESASDKIDAITIVTRRTSIDARISSYITVESSWVVLLCDGVGCSLMDCTSEMISMTMTSMRRHERVSRMTGPDDWMTSWDKRRTNFVTFWKQATRTQSCEHVRAHANYATSGQNKLNSNGNKVFGN